MSVMRFTSGISYSHRGAGQAIIKNMSILSIVQLSTRPHTHCQQQSVDIGSQEPEHDAYDRLDRYDPALATTERDLTDEGQSSRFAQRITKRVSLS